MNSYYAELADVINYPISNTSWAAPRPTDADYKVAFSTDVSGNDIYTSDMTEDERYAAALEAALGYFEARYTVENGVVTAAPEGASMEYEVMIPGDGTGNHPCFMLLTLARDALATIGINLIVTDLTQSTDLWDALDAGTCEMWSAAWRGHRRSRHVPDLLQRCGQRRRQCLSGSTTCIQIADPELDQMIMDARASTDQTYRKAMYKACLDIVVDWACEIPVYQRQNAVVFSTERVNMDTVTPDITTFYGWMMEVQNIELN